MAPPSSPFRLEHDFASGTRRDGKDAPTQEVDFGKFRQSGREVSAFLGRLDARERRAGDLRPAHGAASRGTRFDVEPLSETDVGEVLAEVQRSPAVVSRSTSRSGDENAEERLAFPGAAHHRRT